MADFDERLNWFHLKDKDLRDPENDPPDQLWSVRVLFPWNNSALNNNYTLEMCVLEKIDLSDNHIGTLVKRFHDPESAFDYGEKRADFDKVVLVQFWEKSAFWLLPWATKWTKSFPYQNIYQFVPDIMIRTKFDEFGGYNHFRKYHYEPIS